MVVSLLLVRIKMLFGRNLICLYCRNFLTRIHLSTKTSFEPKNEMCPPYMDLSEALCTEAVQRSALIKTMIVHDDFFSESEENSLLEEIEPYMKRLKYEFDHWDDAIHGYRETERGQWNELNTKILDRVRKIAFPPGVAQLRYVHILDLEKNGYIKPHIDAVRFCGDTIAGLSLLTDSVMRLVHDKSKTLYADVLLKRRSLYIMKGIARFEYTHEILANKSSCFKGNVVLKDRRISVICRNEPDLKNREN